MSLLGGHRDHGVITVGEAHQYLLIVQVSRWTLGLSEFRAPWWCVSSWGAGTHRGPPSRLASLSLASAPSPAGLPPDITLMLDALTEHFPTSEHAANDHQPQCRAPWEDRKSLSASWGNPGSVKKGVVMDWQCLSEHKMGGVGMYFPCVIPPPCNAQLGCWSSWQGFQGVGGILLHDSPQPQLD